jgi:hypothetical protein
VVFASVFVLLYLRQYCCTRKASKLTELFELDEILVERFEVEDVCIEDWLDVWQHSGLVSSLVV